MWTKMSIIFSVRVKRLDRDRHAWDTRTKEQDCGSLNRDGRSVAVGTPSRGDSGSVDAMALPAIFFPFLSNSVETVLQTQLGGSTRTDCLLFPYASILYGEMGKRPLGNQECEGFTQWRDCDSSERLAGKKSAIF